MHSPEVDPTQVQSGPLSEREIRILQITLGDRAIGRFILEDRERSAGLSEADWVRLVGCGAVELALAPTELHPVITEKLGDQTNGNKR